MNTVFLGGTCGNNNWREDIFIDLGDRGVDASGLFNPVVADWNEEAQANEERHKVEDDYLLFFLSNPEQQGNPLSTYSLVEATMALYDRPDKTVVCFDHEAIEGAQFQKAFNQSEKVLRARFPEANILSSYDDLLDWLESVLPGD
jgi:hypothetical protein